MTTLALAEIRFRQFLALTKPRVVQLIVFCAVIGMLLAVRACRRRRRVLRHARHRAGGRRRRGRQLPGRAEDRRADARTRGRPLPRGELTSWRRWCSRALVGGPGLWCCTLVNPLTMWLTLATFVGYAVIYTVVLKPATPQNIVIGGASGAMPPVLGWAAVTGESRRKRCCCSSSSSPGRRRISGRWRFTGRRTTRSPACRCCRSRTATRYTRLQDRALHARAGRGDAAAVRDPHERPALPRRGAALGGVFLRYAVRLYRDYSDAPRAGDVPLLDRLPRGALLGAADRPLSL